MIIPATPMSTLSEIGPATASASGLLPQVCAPSSPRGITTAAGRAMPADRYMRALSYDRRPTELHAPDAGAGGHCGIASPSVVNSPMYAHTVGKEVWCAAPHTNTSSVPAPHFVVAQCRAVWLGRGKAVRLGSEPESGRDALSLMAPDHGFALLASQGFALVPGPRASAPIALREGWRGVFNGVQSAAGFVKAWAHTEFGMMCVCVCVCVCASPITG